MSRFALLVAASALMLIIAACDASDDDNGTDDTTDDTTELPTETDDSEDATTVVPEGEETETTDPDEGDGTTEPDDETGDEAPDEEGTVTPGDDEASEPGDEEAAMDPEEMQPGPDEGMFFDLSFEEAQDLTSFELREPAELPDGVEFQTIMGMASPQASEEERSEEATTVTIAYIQTPSDETQQGLPLELTQTTEMDMSEGLPEEAETNDITVGDREVTHVQLTSQAGDEITAYLWQQDDVYFSLAAILGPDLDESELEEMVASVPAS